MSNAFQSLDELNREIQALQNRKKKLVFDMSKFLIEKLTGLKVPDSVKSIILNFSLEVDPDWNTQDILIVMDDMCICYPYQEFPSSYLSPTGFYRKFSTEMALYMYNPEGLGKQLKAFRALISDEDYEKYWSIN